MGVELKREPTGKLFPITDTARTVLHALLDRCRNLGVEIRTGQRVRGIEGVDGRFTVHTAGEAIYANAVILATGGRSLPKSGSDGSGYALARSLGHSLTPTVPALVPLILGDTMFHERLSGLSHDVTITTSVRGKPVDVRTGSLLWTHFGVSGPVVMDASRCWTWAREQGNEAEVSINVRPDWTTDTARQWIMTQAKASPRKSLVKMLAPVLSERLVEAVCGHVKVDPTKAAAQLPRDERERLLGALIRLPLPVMRDRGWNHAEVTAGGIPLEEIDYRTMESRMAPGLHVIGEILDCDGRIGGYNFQWAWATGYLAGRAAIMFPRR
jgi:predicted Rossmann fold flavoprotein